MNKHLLRILSLSIALAASSCVQAEQYMFTYSKLYSQLKNNLKSGHDDVKVGFFFVDSRTELLCTISKAWMEKEQHYEELKVSPINELVVPLDQNLRQANPLIFVETPRSQQCNFSMVVMAKQNLSGTVSYQTLAQLVSQMQTTLNDLGGMFARWFTPEIQGVTLEFDADTANDIQLSNGKKIRITHGQAQVTLNEIGEGGSIKLPQTTKRVLPYLLNTN